MTSTTSTSTTSKSSTSDLLRELIVAQNEAMTAIQEQGAKLTELTTTVEQLAAKPAPQPRSETQLSKSQLDAIATMTVSACKSAVEAAVPAPSPHSAGDARIDAAIEALDGQAKRTVGAIRRARRELEDVEENLGPVLTVAWLGRLAQVAVPFAVIAVMLGMLIMPISSILGVGPISRWAWDGFAHAHSAWARLGITALVFAVAGAVGYGAYRAGRWLHAHYQSEVSRRG